MTTPSPSTDAVQAFFALLRSALEGGAFVNLILGKYRGDDPGLQRVMIRAVTIKEEARLSFVYRYERKDIAKNFPIPAGFEAVHDLIASGFRSAHLFTLAEDILLEFNKKGEPKLVRSKATQKAAPATAHNREKQRLVNPAAPFLWELGVTNSEHQVLPSMSRKWKQINVFLELFEGALNSSGLAKAESVRVVDFGSGKGYLTFAVYDYLCGVVGNRAQVLGIEARPELVQFCNEAAKKTGMTNLRFSPGDVHSPVPEKVDVMIALHAYDTATDLAIHQGIRAGAAVIMCAPCCHKEIRPQMVNPPVLQPVLRFGIQQAQEAEMVTDSIRALLLEASGYEAQIFEFVSPEHTAKNKMILAVKRAGPSRREAALAQLRELKAFYGIREQCLEKLISSTNFTN
jgi:SAM-dependent methyltransferase